MLLPLGVILLGIIAVPLAFAETTYEEHIIEPVTTFGYSGCQDKDGCYNPVTTHAEHGDVIIFNNTDFVAHTFTSGTPDDGPSGIFDSNLKLPRYSFQWQADTVGEIPYFCTVHPWMTGLIIVNGDAPVDPRPKVDSEELQQVLDYLTGLITGITVQIEAIMEKQNVLEERLDALEAQITTNPDTDMEPEQPENPEQPTEPETPETPEPEQPEPDQRTAVVEGYVYFDSNGNGMFDDDESALEGDINIDVRNAAGNLVGMSQISDGYYSLSFHPDSLAPPDSGPYQAVFRSHVDGYYLSIDLTVSEGQTIRQDVGFDTLPGTNVFITTDKTAYSLGDTIQISGFVNVSIFEETVSDERLGTTIVYPKFRNVYISIYGQNTGDSHMVECYLLTEDDAHRHPDLEVGTFYVSYHSDGIDGVEGGDKCFDDSGNFNFDFVVHENYYADSFVAEFYVSGLYDSSPPFTVG